MSTKEKSLLAAKEFAEDWFFKLRQQKTEGTLVTGKTFAEAAKRFTDKSNAWLYIASIGRSVRHIARSVKRATEF